MFEVTVSVKLTSLEPGAPDRDGAVEAAANTLRAALETFEDLPFSIDTTAATFEAIDDESFRAALWLLDPCGDVAREIATHSAGESSVAEVLEIACDRMGGEGVAEVPDYRNFFQCSAECGPHHLAYVVLADVRRPTLVALDGFWRVAPRGDADHPPFRFAIFKQQEVRGASGIG